MNLPWMLRDDYILIYESKGNIQVLRLKLNRKPKQALWFTGLSNLRTWGFMPMQRIFLKPNLSKTLQSFHSPNKNVSLL